MTMLRFLLAIVATIVAAPFVWAPAAYAAAATPLDAYLDDMKTLRASFVQTLADAHGKEIDRSTGTLIVSRPGKFSWEIHPRTSGSSRGQLKIGRASCRERV